MSDKYDVLSMKVIDSNECESDSELMSTVDGYEFNISNLDCDDGEWYIQINPEGEGFLYDGYWISYVENSLVHAVREAIIGSCILDDEE